jgi:hypothetical protein
VLLTAALHHCRCCSTLLLWCLSPPAGCWVSQDQR